MATVVTNAGKAYLTSVIRLTGRPATEPNYLEIGTTATDDAATRTTLIAAVETRANGTSAQATSVSPAVTNDTYRTVGTITATATRSIVEAGMFTASTAGTMVSRSTFTAVALASGDSIQLTYDITLT